MIDTQVPESSRVIKSYKEFRKAQTIRILRRKQGAVRRLIKMTPDLGSLPLGQALSGSVMTIAESALLSTTREGKLYALLIGGFVLLELL